MNQSPDPYIVLARKYRPEKFSELVGQETLVRVIGNSIKANQIAHAFILSGVRGVGKTTTARLIAKSLNCIGPESQNKPVISVCGVCPQCQSIAKGTNIDVFEMDAASRTGVDDIREIIESVKFQPNSARYKVYIIDEVHMLSNSAFNAILKTLEEPPPNVKFIFATTSIRSVPVTILSRCQRFDLRRIKPEIMVEHLNSIAIKENVQIETDALKLISRSSEGSVRDAISLLDQAIAFSNGKISADNAREMLGLADRSRILDLIEIILKGDASSALKELNEQYHLGADPRSILLELADTIHWLTISKLSPDTLEDPSFSTEVRERGIELSNQLNYPMLIRYWQMLLKVIDELNFSPNAKMSAEMAIVRLTSVSDLPTPMELVNSLRANSQNLTEDRAKTVSQGKTQNQRSKEEVSTKKSTVSETTPNPKESDNLKEESTKHTNSNELADPLKPQSQNTKPKNKQNVEEIKNNALVQSVFREFPNAQITSDETTQ